jgi:hypothetical protein
MAEEVVGVLGSNELDGLGEGDLQRLRGASASTPQVPLDRGQGLLDGRDVGRVSRQEDEVAAARLDEGTDLVVLVAGEVSAQDDLAGT